MKVLVTGAAGYIGSVLTRKLLGKGYRVYGVDSLMYGGESLISVYNNPMFSFHKIDLVSEGEKLQPVLAECDAVVHLAAIVGDPACAKNPELARAVNWTGSKNLFDASSKNENVKKFVFASTCSNYGKMKGDELITEESELNPISLYAELKVEFEKYLLSSDLRGDFIPTVLRFSTVYGLSPRSRFDLTVNEFMKEVALDRELLIFGEQFWRPYCHVEDLARACIAVIEADEKIVRKEVFNVGDTNENYQKKMLADEILKIRPDAKISYVHKNEDPRDYRVSFEKIKKVLGFEITKTVPDGLKEIENIVLSGLISDPDSERYRNI